MVAPKFKKNDISSHMATKWLQKSRCHLFTKHFYTLKKKDFYTLKKRKLFDRELGLKDALSGRRRRGSPSRLLRARACTVWSRCPRGGRRTTTGIERKMSTMTGIEREKAVDDERQRDVNGERAARKRLASSQANADSVSLNFWTAGPIPRPACLS